jgi:hypothetical protein
LFVPRPVAYISQVRVSEAVAAKIATKHNVTVAEVNEVVVLCPVIRSGWHHDPDRGWRLLVKGTTHSGRVLNVVLYPLDESEGIWRLGTAMPARP